MFPKIPGFVSPQTQLQTLPTSLPQNIYASCHKFSWKPSQLVVQNIHFWEPQKAAPQCPSAVAKITQMSVGRHASPVLPTLRAGKPGLGHTLNTGTSAGNILRASRSTEGRLWWLGCSGSDAKMFLLKKKETPRQSTWQRGAEDRLPVADKTSSIMSEY